MRLSPRELEILRQARLIAPSPPGRALAGIRELLRWGTNLAGAYAGSAARDPQAIAVWDELGPLSFQRLITDADAIAHELLASGLGQDERVAILARNSRYFVQAALALSRLGHGIVYLNTMMAAAEIASILDREQVRWVIADEEFLDRLSGRRVLLARHSRQATEATLAGAIVRHYGRRLEPPARRHDDLILTSGTTGAAKGAQRGSAPSLAPLAGILERIPFRVSDRVVLAAPLFHNWGSSCLLICAALRMPVILRPQFTAQQCLDDLSQHRARALIGVPTMLDRLLDADESEIRHHDLRQLDIVAVSGSALPSQLSQRFHQRFGPVLYNVYGSTEASGATVADPLDLHRHPGAAGRPLMGVNLRLFDSAGQQVAPGQVGEIHVTTPFLFRGYSDGSQRHFHQGLMATGDLGHLTEDGVLMVDGRADELIISGGEKFFPSEIEDVLHRHPDISDVHVYPVTDQQWGQAAEAVVVKRAGAKLNEQQTREFVARHLARYKIPRRIIFSDRLERNPLGKVRRDRLPKA